MINLYGKDGIMNFLIQRYGYETYLEIGGQPASERATYHKVNCRIKDSIDPDPNAAADDLPNGMTHHFMTSDEFFEKNAAKKKFDLVFIDGYHEHQQVLRDINNSLDCLTENGTIVLHDMLPPTRELEVINRTGTGWRAFADLRASREDLMMFTCPPPWGTEDGLGVIRMGSQALFTKDLEYNYDFFLENRDQMMNITTPTGFLANVGVVVIQCPECSSNIMLQSNE